MFGYLEFHSIYIIDVIIITTTTIIITMLYITPNYETCCLYLTFEEIPLDFENQTLCPQMNLTDFRRIRAFHPGGVLEMSLWR